MMRFSPAAAAILLLALHAVVSFETSQNVEAIEKGHARGFVKENKDARKYAGRKLGSSGSGSSPSGPSTSSHSTHSSSHSSGSASSPSGPSSSSHTTHSSSHSSDSASSPSGPSSSSHTTHSSSHSSGSASSPSGPSGSSPSGSSSDSSDSSPSSSSHSSPSSSHSSGSSSSSHSHSSDSRSTSSGSRSGSGSESGSGSTSLTSRPYKSSSEKSDVCLGECKGSGEHRSCTFNFKVDLFTSELGYFRAEECDKTNPTIGIQKRVTYYFNQYNLSNYMHPLGFNYFPNGAHDDIDELEPGIAPPGSESDCDRDLTCPAPMYLLNDEYIGVYSNNENIADKTEDEEDFGLDVYEPDFLRDPVTWKASGKYSVALKFDHIDDFDGDIFYFCHVHQFMTGRMKFVDSDGHVIMKTDEPDIPYDYDMPSEYDQSRGTFNLEQYQLPNKECQHRFLCGIPDDDADVAQFADCIESMDCAMTVGMTTGISAESVIALFNHQMIPHHQNAVNMAKALLKANEIDCDDITNEDDDDCVMLKTMYEIINGQNMQIQQMRSVLENKGYPQEDDCVVKVKQSRGLFGDFM